MVNVFPSSNYGDTIQPVTLADKTLFDRFNRLRVVNPTTYYESVLQYHKDAHFWKEKLVNGASSVLMQNEPSVLMTAPTIGSEIIRQTFTYWPYQGGNTQLVFMTMTHSPDPGAESGVGYYDGKNGIAWVKSADGEYYIELLSSVSGAPKYRRYVQRLTGPKREGYFPFNGDPLLAGANNSSHNELDPTKSPIFWIDISYLAIGGFRAGFVFGNTPLVAVEYNHANTDTSPFMSTASLPVRYWLKNVSSLTPVTMKAICSSVKSEGGAELFGTPQIAKFGPTAVAQGVDKTLISVRPADLYQNRENRGFLIPFEFKLYVQGNFTLEYDFVHGGDVVGGNWLPITTGGIESPSLTEYSTDVTSITGGHVHNGGWAPGGVKGEPTTGSDPSRSTIYISNGIDITDKDHYSIVGRGIDGGITARGLLRVAEVY